MSFQLNSRTITVPISYKKPNRYAFQEIVVETSTEDATQVVEKFYSMDNPLRAKLKNPYVHRRRNTPLLLLFLPLLYSTMVSSNGEAHCCMLQQWMPPY